MTIRADLEALAADRGLTVRNFTDAQIEAIAMDCVAEFGERMPTSTELASVLFRYQDGHKPPMVVGRKPAISPLEALKFHMKHPVDELIGGKHRDRVIRERFGVSGALFELALLRAMDDPACIRAHPAATARLRRTRDRRRALREGSSA